MYQLNEAELEVDSDKASYKQKLEVLQQQEELIEDEEEQETKEAKDESPEGQEGRFDGKSFIVPTFHSVTHTLS